MSRSRIILHVGTWGGSPFIAAAITAVAVVLGVVGSSHGGDGGKRDQFPDSDYPRWLQQLKEVDNSKRLEAINTLAIYYGDRHQEDLIGRLAVLARDSDPAMRRGAIYGLHGIVAFTREETHGSAAKVVEPVIIQCYTIRTFLSGGRRSNV